ncbi:MAG: CDP-alcohol phosphatidyltransferase family protein [Candidatus Diapherotrites archaeon]|nr:CDP-alcohol phosphatidyltransferase family protein [Candidatus Diapherotrites archaeon]
MEIKTKGRIEAMLLAPIAKRMNMSPNYITAFSILLCIIAGYFILQNALLPAATFWLLSGIFDSLDGEVAKTHRRATKFGSLFDKVADRINDAIILSAIILAGLVELWVGLLALTLITIASYASACLDAQVEKTTGERISLRAVRTAIIFLGLLVPAANAVRYAVYAVLLIGAYALASRLVYAKRVLG